MKKELTLTEVVPLWLTARSYAPTSRALREIQADRFVTFVGDVPPAEVDFVDVLRWWESTEQMKPNSRRSAWMAMRGLFRWCCSVGLATSNPVEAVRPPRAPDLAPNAVTDDELARMRELLPEGPVRLAVALAAGAGLRRAEILGLRGCDVDRSAEPWLMTVRRKGGNVQVLPVESDWLRAELADVGTSREPLVPMAPARLTYRVKRLMAEAGIVDRSLHSLRHYYAQHALTEMPVNRVQKLLGHKSLQTTGRYLAV
jgi:integrase